MGCSLRDRPVCHYVETPEYEQTAYSASRSGRGRGPRTLPEGAIFGRAKTTGGNFDGNKGGKDHDDKGNNKSMPKARINGGAV